MDSHRSARAGASSSPPPRPPPKDYYPTSQQRLPSLSNPSRSLKTNSPVRRKPLPSTAFSPPAATPPGQGGTAVSRTTQDIDALPPSRQHPAPRIVEFPQEETFEATPPVLTRQDTADSHSLTKSSTNGTLPQISTEDYPDSPTGDEVQWTRSNGLLSNHTASLVEDMGQKPPSRPPPLRTDSSSSTKSLSVNEPKKPQTPGSKFTSFFTRKPSASPGAESSVTEISDSGRSPLASPYAGSPHTSTHSSRGYPFASNGTKGPPSQHSQDSIDFDGGAYLHPSAPGDLAGRYAQLEAELREISTELAGSIKREMDLEDLVERLQGEGLSIAVPADRTSDYFSDSGTSPIRPSTSEYSAKDEIDRIKRESDQQRAHLKVELSQRWQAEAASRRTLESHVQILEHRLSQSRRDTTQSQDLSARARELETALEDAKRRLNEERKTKENFEDLLTALRVELEQNRNERDNLRDEVVPQLRSRLEGLESSLTEAQKSPYDLARMQQELQSLRDENAALQSARAMNMQFGSIAEEGVSRKAGGLQRSSTIHLSRANSRAGLNRSNSQSRSNSVANHASMESPQPLADQIKAIEQQRDALHSTVKYLLRRQELERRQFEKRVKSAEAERDRATSLTSPRKAGYEKEVRVLRSEINLLRKRADDALDQKWQCEKGLAGLKMDLDRSKQETSSLQKLLQARDDTAPEVLSSTLEQALLQLQQEREQARGHESIGSLEHEQQLADELEMSAERSQALAAQVKQQIRANTSLRNRLKEAVEKGEHNQHMSAAQINDLQLKLRKLEDVITTAQTQSETAVMKHEEDIRVLRASHNVQLMRPRSGAASTLLTPAPRSPLSPLFANSKKSPRLDKTSTGPGIALHQALQTEYLENKVAELEKALAEAEKEMGEVIGRMNTAQIGVAELESERDEALRQTRRLEAAIAAEREKVQLLLDLQ